MTKVLQVCRLQNTANISHMTTLTLISLRNTEGGVVCIPLVIYFSNTDRGGTKFSCLAGPGDNTPWRKWRLRGGYE